MEQLQGKVTTLQESLGGLPLQAKEEKEDIRLVMVGKVLTARSFRRFIISEIITKTWRLNRRVQIEKLGENVFKFGFGSTEDKDNIFKNRPWSLNGSHLILKEWPLDKCLSEISFNTSTFFIQIHGLPPVYLHEGTAQMLGSKIGDIHKSSINRKCVVAHRYLRFRVDIKVTNPLPAGFFLERNNGNDLWIQFKLERLSDFCYKCGLLDHVTGRCTFEKPALITNPNRISSKVFGPWLRSENSGNLLFINQPDEDERRDPETAIQKGKNFLQEVTHAPELCYYDDSQTMGLSAEVKRDPKKDFQNAQEMSSALASLRVTLERQVLGSVIAPKNFT